MGQQQHPQKKSQTIKVKTVDVGDVDRFNPRNRIYVRKTDGIWTQLRRRMGWVMMLLFLVLPWIPWGERQAVLFDLAERKFHVFGLTIWPQDLILLAFILMMAAFGLFFVTTFLGRVWCGYMCPQSVWTFIFIWFEEKIEGARNKRIKMDKAPWSWDKLWRKTAKHSAWIGVSLLTSLTFLSYFNSTSDLYIDFFSGSATFTVYFWALFFTGATYGNAGWMREIMCLHMCPYARFQSVMFDTDTFIVGYNTDRGETRGPRGRKQDHKALGLGDCIDCNLCVQVCPTGIDIRNGLQYECINCGACIDACDEVMTKMHYPKGLISYTTERNLNGGKSNVARPKLIGYGVAFAVILAAFFYMLVNLSPLQLDVLRDRNSLYRENASGLIENVYTLKLINKSEQQQIFNLSLLQLDGHQWQGPQQVVINGGEVLTVPISIAIEPGSLTKPVVTVIFKLTNPTTNATVEQESRFFSRI
ncbi:cytochrome c oxidase accessory protein CcoG [Ferrimonas lipolytica]|uniref:Cytochrome c oxidase accessory protein CcoG n=1 Tax=Ferrimonas lipolytica TaxID=2724191 RepID=A0A6H1UGM8_9GAMM|nr:cytochrome c oxidase accessory protein CcoG [Ferrimonas lipolytica]QIZ78241.1 cytochrome c oxidase accessory protein CcoG [Ferrimonas lipolytica]